MFIIVRSSIIFNIIYEIYIIFYEGLINNIIKNVRILNVILSPARFWVAYRRYKSVFRSYCYSIIFVKKLTTPKKCFTLFMTQK